MGTDINSVAPKLRDELLRKNLIVSDYIKNSSYSSLATGLGKPIDPFFLEQKVINSIPITNSAQEYRFLSSIWNKYIGTNEVPQIENLNKTYQGKQEIEYTKPNEGESILEQNSLKFIKESTAGNKFKENKEYVKPNDGESILEKISIDNRKETTRFNQYIDFEGQETYDINNELTNIQVKEQRPNYIDYINSIDNSFLKEATNVVEDVFGSGLNITTSLTNAVLTSITGNDTKLGGMSKYYLAKAMSERIANNIKKETVGQLNTDVFGLLNGESFIKDDFKITAPSTVAGKILDIAADTIGLSLPTPELPDLELSNFSYFKSKTLKEYRDERDGNENTSKSTNFLSNLATKLYYGSDVSNEDFNGVNSLLIKNSGKGQTKILYKNLSENVYTPNYKNFSGNNSELPDNEYGGNISAGENILSNQDELVLKNNNYELNWVNQPKSNIFDNRINDNISFGDNKQKSLLEKTHEMFNNGTIKSLNSSKYIGGKLGERTQINNAISNYDGQILNTISKGNNVVSSVENGKPVFCRVWTFDNQYSKVNNLIRHEGLLNRNGINSKYSVLDDNGFVKIAPYKNDKSLFKKYMFSIENLAWADYINQGNLHEWEIGNGDPTTGTKGRIMWFPPYDLSFNETTNSNWENTVFIGRTEPVYTFSTTERSGNISFKIIVDHSEYINNITFNEKLNQDQKEGKFNRFIAGCGTSLEEIKKDLTKEQQRKVKLKEVNPIQQKINNNKKNYELKVYFPNGYSGVKESEVSNALEIIKKYENGNNTLAYTPDDYGNVNDVRYNVNNSDFSLNNDFIKFIDEDSQWKPLIDILNESKNVKLKIFGYASKHGNSKTNKTLSDNRATTIKNILVELFPSLSSQFELVNGKGESLNDSEGVDYKKITVDTKIAKENRYVQIYAEYDAKVETDELKDQTNDKDNLDNTITNDDLNLYLSGYYNEGDYFEKMEQDTPFVFEKITEKLKYFQPGFHSTSPIGLNSRLTFLQQCMRPGKTEKNLDTPDNLAFGRPPVCILRIGDFFNTKIIIESLNINYEPLIWDLNPEGIGVQPMLASVDMSIKFIGGSDLGGCINKLQNALDFNFYANTSVYDSRSTTIDKNK